MAQHSPSHFGLTIRITLKDGRTVEFRDSRIQRKDRDRLVAIFDRRYTILAEFPSEEVLECLEQPVSPASPQWS